MRVEQSTEKRPHVKCAEGEPVCITFPRKCVISQCYCCCCCILAACFCATLMLFLYAPAPPPTLCSAEMFHLMLRLFPPRHYFVSLLCVFFVVVVVVVLSLSLQLFIIIFLPFCIASCEFVGIIKYIFVNATHTDTQRPNGSHGSLTHTHTHKLEQGKTEHAPALSMNDSGADETTERKAVLFSS